MKALIFAVLAIAAALWIAGYHLRQHPTADELYGCTVKQQAPNGECK